MNKEKIIKKKVSVSRRQFLKKTVYVTPSIIVLGQLAQPTYVNAKGGYSGPPGQANGKEFAAGQIKKAEKTSF